MSNTTQRIRLEFHASKLKNLQSFGKKSNPYAIVSQLGSSIHDKPLPLGKTEVYVKDIGNSRLSLTLSCSLKSNLHPHWTTAFVVDYILGVPLRVNITILDSPSQKPMGSAVFDISEVLGAAKGSTKAKQVRPSGLVYCRATPASNAVGCLILQVTGHDLLVKMRKTKLRYEMQTQIQSAGGTVWQTVYRSPIQATATWPVAHIDIDRLSSTSLRLAVWDDNKPLGFLETNLEGLQGMVSSLKGLPLNEAKQGRLQIVQAYVENGGSQSTGSAAAPPAVSAPVLTTTSTPRLQPQAPQSDAGTGGFANVLNNPGLVQQQAAQQQQPKPVAMNAPPQATAPPTAPPQATAPPTAPPQATAPPPAPYNPTSAATKPYVPTMPSPQAPAPTMSYGSVQPLLPKPTFVDYMTGGCELDLTIAIDFTGSNGDPRVPGTLHYLSSQLNDYEKAITAVASVIAPYDHDQTFPVYGFGAKQNGILQNAFEITRAHGIPAILQAYRQVFGSGVVMSGPTSFQEVIDLVAVTATSRQEQYVTMGRQAYTVLLILTDGAVADVAATQQALRRAADAPLSVVIVGIGNEDFGAMQFLDDFAHEAQIRDICQFVEFRQHADSKTSLTRATMEEIPQQLVDYFQVRGMEPMQQQTGGSFSSLAASEADEAEIDLAVDEAGQVVYGNAPVYDDANYGTYDTYANMTALPPPMVPPAQQPTTPTPYVPGQQPQAQPQAPYVPSQSQAPSASTPYIPSQPQAPSAPYVPSSHSQATQAPNVPSQPPAPFVPNQSALYQAAPPSNNQIFHVQVPPGTGPGTQLQVTNPFTQQRLLVTIPPGVAPGGKFAVSS